MKNISPTPVPDPLQLGYQHLFEWYREEKNSSDKILCPIQNFIPPSAIKKEMLCDCPSLSSPALSGLKASMQ